MSSTMRTLAILAILGSTALGAGAAPASAEGPRRFALLVGANHGPDDRAILRYAGSDVDTIDRVLRDLGGLRAGDRSVLVEPSPADLGQAFAAVASAVEGGRAAGAPTQFFFYYSGHSDEEGLLLGSQRVGYDRLRELIGKIPADVRVGILDSCASGAMTRLKGGARREPFLADAAAVTGHAFLTSSSDSEAAQESDRVGGSFFTHYLATGLRGAADVNGDRQITLNEAYRFAYDETLERTLTTQGGAQHPSYDIQLVGSGDLVMTDLRRTSARLVIEGEVHGRVFVRDGEGALAAELYKPMAAPAVLLALEPGIYGIVVDDDGALWEADLTLPDGGTATLVRSALRAGVAEATRQRGGGGGAAGGSDHTLVLQRPGYRVVPVTTGLFPPLLVNRAFRDRKVVNHVALNLIFGHATRIEGFELSPLGGRVDEAVQGVQVTGAVGSVGGTLRGAQFSCGLNHARTVWGVQVGGINVGRELHGVQVGAVNVVAGRARGVQIGAVNIADDADASIGLIGVTRRHGVGLDLFVSDVAPVNLGARFRARYTYTGIQVGLDPRREGGHWSAGAVMGLHLPLSRVMYLELDAGAHGIMPLSSWHWPAPMLATERLMLGVRVVRPLRIWIGVTFNELLDWQSRYEVRPGLPYHVHGQPFGEEGTLWLWPGFAVGIELNPARG